MTIIRANSFEWVPENIRAGSVDLFSNDPPYGKIVEEDWDREWTIEDQWKMTRLMWQALAEGGTAYVWGGIGTYRNRIFFEWLGALEQRSDFRIWDVITWKKKRGYGVADRYLFTREECAMLVKGNRPKTFNKPYLAKERGYAGYNPQYPAHSKYLRCTNVWDDIPEIFRGKIHRTQKPTDLARRIVATSSNPGDLVVDMFAGAGGTGLACEELGRRYTLIERSDCQMLKGIS